MLSCGIGYVSGFSTFSYLRHIQLAVGLLGHKTPLLRLKCISIEHLLLINF